MTKVFISYARDDGKAIAQELEHRLLVRGHKAFLDVHGIPGGVEWEKELIYRTRWCDTLLILVTNSSNKSKYVYQEFREAEKNKKKIVPIQVNGIDIPNHVQHLNALPLTFISREENSLDSVILGLEDIWKEISQRHFPRIVLVSIILLILVVAFARFFVIQNFEGNESPVESSVITPKSSDVFETQAAITLTPSTQITATTLGGGGNKIAFYSDRTDQNSIYTMRTDGSERTNLTQSFSIDWSPEWSPDGTVIAFTSNYAGNDEVYFMQEDGSNWENLTEHESADMLPAWSLNGQQIAFQSNRNGDFEIFIVNIDGSDLIQVTKNEQMDTAPAWSPDGEWIAFTRGEKSAKEIYIISSDGNREYNLTRTDGLDDDAAWSQDGTYIAFTSNRDGNKEIYIMESDGTNPQNITNHISEDFLPAWSPDDNFIAFTTNRDGNWEIYIYNLETRQETNITKNAADDWFPAWQPQ